MIVATFAPASYPLLFELILIVGATFFGSARYACGVTTLVSALGHIAFLSFHRANASGIFFQRVAFEKLVPLFSGVTV